MLGSQLWPEAAGDDHEPEHEPHGERELPEPSEVQVFPALRADPPGGGGRLDDVAVAQRLAGERADDHDHQRDEQDAGELALMRRLRPSDHRGEKDPDRQIRGRDEEQRELQVPGPGQVIGEPGRDVDPEEGRRLGVVVGVRAAAQPLEQEQPGHHQEEPDGGPLSGREAHLVGRAKRDLARRRPAGVLRPAERLEAAERQQRQADPAEQGHERQRGPEDRVGGQRVSDLRRGRPVVRVRVRLARAIRGRDPGRPGEVRRQRMHRLGRDGGTAEPGLALRRPEPAPVFVFDLRERRGLRGGERQDVAARVEAVRLEVLDDAGSRVGASIVAIHRGAGALDVVGGEVRAEIGAVPEDRPVLHETVLPEHQLSLLDVLPREQGRAVGRDGDPGDRGMLGVDAVGEVAEDSESDDEGENGDLDPGPGYGERRSRGPGHLASLFSPVGVVNRGRWMIPPGGPG